MTCSPNDYITYSLNARSRRYYNFIGVYVEIDTLVGNLIESFAKEVPNDAEVVVDYRASVATSSHYTIQLASGTALIPKTPQK